ncbi:MAG: hypothetical protein Q8L49_02375 [Burkholderiaceae bacterium]|nr:hypothetical protein [Burkholderiaceae bacterium]
MGVPIALLAALWIVSIAYGVGMGGVLRHAPWYMWGDHNRVPVWMESIDQLGGKAGPDGPVSSHFDPIEAWGLDADEMRKLLHKHGVLTDAWRSELQEAWATGNIESKLASYRNTNRLIFKEYFGKIDKEKWAGLSGLRAPLSVLCSGCKPNRESAHSFLIHLNAAPRLVCDWLIGSTLWLLVTSLVLVPAMLRLDARKRSVSKSPSI